MKSTKYFDLPEQGIGALKTMLMIREFERRLPGYAEQKLIRGSTHPSVGMEAIAVGVSMALSPQDKIVSNHRGHAHCLARGTDPGRTLAEIFGRSDGYCMGKGGSMHIGVRELGILGTNGIVGAGIGLATGAALSSVLSGGRSVAIAYFGDGASNQGILAESMNLAAIWKLPVIYICENNHYAQSSSFDDMVAQRQIIKRGQAYGVRSYDVDGMDVVAVYELATEAIEHARAGNGPVLIIADTYRFLGHMAADTLIYRKTEEVEQWKERDPVPKLVNMLMQAKLLDRDQLVELMASASKIVDEAEKFAAASPYPRPGLAFEQVYSNCK